jgi:DNA-binding MarR family transcriptional regulator
MSVTVMRFVWQLSTAMVNPAERLVLLCLADHAHHDGTNAWPAVGRVAKRTSLSRRGVQKALRRLANKGLILSQSGVRRSVLYALNVEQMTALIRSVDCEPRSQSMTPHCEPGSQSATISTPDDCESGSGRGEPDSGRGEPSAPHCEPRSPDPDLNRHLNHQGRKCLGANAPDFHALKHLATTVCRESANASFTEKVAEVKRRADEQGVPWDEPSVGFVTARVAAGL